VTFLSLSQSYGNSIITGAIAYMDVLIRIKRAVLAGHYAFSEKARVEMETDDLTELDVAESILNAVAIYKRLRSSSPLRNKRREYLYVIQSTNLDGLQYTQRESSSKRPELKPTIFWFLLNESCRGLRK
jgi:hypothetical protein